MPTAVNYRLRQLEKVFLAMQTDPMTMAPPTSQACLVSKFDLKQNIATIKRPDVAGTRSTLPGQKGRMYGTWSTELSMAGSGTPGTPDDCDPILQCGFGQAPTVTAGTSLVYNLSDNIPSFSAYLFNKDATLTQRASGGSVVKEISFTMGQDVAMIQASGESIFTPNSDDWGNYTSQLKMGLASFPTYPATPVTHGNFAIGFTGAVSMGSDTITRLKTAKVTINTGNEIIKDTFGFFIGSGVIGDERKVTIEFDVDDTDESAARDLKAHAYAKDLFNISFGVGLVPGNIWTFTLTDVQLNDYDYKDGLKYTAGYSASEAHGSSPSALDNLVLTRT